MDGGQDVMVGWCHLAMGVVRMLSWHPWNWWVSFLHPWRFCLGALVKDRSDFGELFVSLWADGRDGAMCCGFKECLFDIQQAGGNQIVSGGTWHWDMVWEPDDGVGDMFAICFGDICVEASVQVHCRTNVPSCDCMHAP